MPSRLQGRGLYVITDGPRPNLLEAVAQALAGGARLLQYRDKTADHDRRLAEARAIRALCAARGIPMIVNDDVQLAIATNAAGVHLGEDDGDVAAAREALGTDAILGVSCYDSLERARRFAAMDVDYVAFGTFFPSPTKPHARRAPFELLRQSATLGVPRVAIGGITPDNGQPLIDAGADYLAVISAVFGDPDVRGAAARFAQLFTTH
ncbi:thiamine phosphate synthase [Dyella sedimenti]|uniref:thiamine phosphate synthase n=1 Tax=Dyella sedimenti TaxID=2919947 RepID=UPI001FA9FB0B|nr:thiamine phosphate synthase [Dyella sedimenti]